MLKSYKYYNAKMIKARYFLAMKNQNNNNMSFENYKLK